MLWGLIHRDFKFKIGKKKLLVETTTGDNFFFREIHYVVIYDNLQSLDLK